MPAAVSYLAESALRFFDDSLHHFAGGVYAKQMLIPAGTAVAQHKHHFDHLSILASGSVEVEVDGIRTAHVAPACLTIKAGAHHGIKALTDSVWFCLHAADVDDDSALVMPSDPQDMRKLAESML